MHARLALVDGDALPKAVELAPERPISIGRSRDNTVVLPHEEQASRLHARLYFESGRWLLRDFGLNGTRVDDARVNQVAELADGNVIRIGGVKFRFQLPGSGSHHAPIATAVTDRPSISDTLTGSSVGLRWTVDELTALNQFMTAAIAAKDPMELARAAVQSLFYQTGAAFVGFFTSDPTDPIPKVIWPEAGRVDEPLARQLTRRMQRDHRVVWLAEDSGATLPTQSGCLQTAYADALALPLKAGTKVLGAFHLCKANGYFSDRDRKFAEGIAAVAAPQFRSLRSRRALEADIARWRGHASEGDELLGDSPAMFNLRAELHRVVATSRPVLFRGAAGSGKQLAAREAHRFGPRSEGPFVVVRCTAAPVSLLEADLFGYRKGAFSGADRDHLGQAAQADDGTLFFDEVADLSLDCQSRLLQLIERHTYRPFGATFDSRVDVQVMAATRCDLEAAVSAGSFRAELLTALTTSQVQVPSLHDHAEDIPHLAQFILDRIGIEHRREWSLTPCGEHYLKELPWPGNVRQLKTLLDHVAATTAGATIGEVELRALMVAIA